MDPAAVFRQGLGSVPPRPPHYFFPGRPPAPTPYPWDASENDSPSRTAHTLTACCRCRQRKTRCDPTLPRCLPCERSGSTCEYYDSSKGKKINRSYVVSLQKKVRQLEAELSQYTDDEGEYPHNHDDVVRPGGMVRLDETDETPRYLGPSSGIAMTRLLMEEAKRYTESRRIADLIPQVRARRVDPRDRMQSVVMGGSIIGPSGSRKSYPARSILPAPSLPSRETVDGLVRIFNDRVQVFAPILHDKSFREDLDAVFAGDTDLYKLFVVNMVVAISLQKLGGYAGLPDSYYLSAMRHFEDVVRPKDLKTLQCLVLIGQYSLLTPTRTAIYYVIGLATRICQWMGLGDEKTIGLGVSDPQTLDMRRRLSWIVTTQELGVAHVMGRPNGLAKGDDHTDVNFFETVVDEDITPEGVRPGPPCPKKVVAIYFCRMTLLQAEIRRVLYEKKQPQPAHETHPWFAQMEQKLKDWLDSCPEQPSWCRPWFTGCYHNIIISLYRPSPQVPRPTSNAAAKCFEGSRYIINLTSKQLEQGAVDITWVFLLSVYASLNALLWSISYPEVRTEHHKDEVQDLAESALDTIASCSDRWPGTSSAVQLYTVIANACLQSYQVKEETPSPVLSGKTDSPASFVGTISPESDASRSTPASQAQPQLATSLFNTSPFGYVFGGFPDGSSLQYAFDDGPQFQNQPAFRSNSIFMGPSTDSNGRRLSQLAPDSTHSHEVAAPARTVTTPPPAMAVPKQQLISLENGTINTLPTPPELATPSTHSIISLSPSLPVTAAQAATPIATPTLLPMSPAPLPLQHTLTPIIVKQEPLSPRPFNQQQQQQQQQPPSMRRPQRAQAFATPPPPRAQPQFPAQPHPSPAGTQQHRPLPPPPPPPTFTDWFNPAPPLISPHAAFSSAAGPPFWVASPNPFTGLGLSGNEGVATAYGLGVGMSSSSRHHHHQHHPPLSPAAATAAAEGPHWNFDWGGGGAGAAASAAASEAGMIMRQQQPQQQQQQPYLPYLPSSSMAAAFAAANARHGSLSQEQQLELMDVLETEGMHDIDSFLSMGMGLDGGGGGGGGGGDGAVGWA